MQFNNSRLLFDRASQSLVGGVNSPVRAFNSVGGNPILIEKGKGSFIYDVDGNQYIDFVGSYGPLILGHAHPKVTKAVEDATQRSFSYGATSVGEIEMAELIKEAFPQIEKTRFVNSGTEAILSAIRLARAYSGKRKIIKFAGCYHGHSDALLVAAGSGLMTLGVPSSAGVPEEAVKNTLIATYNNIESIKEIIAKHSDDIAAIFIEPVAGNMGVVVPEQRFMEQLRALTKENNILLVIDEVMTGFRQKFGGAQDYFGIQGDITCIGKVIGGGMPVGAYGAKADIMDRLAPLGDVYQAGTLSGNPIAMACGYATLKELQLHNYERANALGKQIKYCLEREAQAVGVDVQVNQFGLMVNPFFNSQPVTNFETASTSDTNLFKKFFWAMIKAGIYIPPSQFESWFIPINLSDAEVELVEKRIKNAFKQLA